MLVYQVTEKLVDVWSEGRQTPATRDLPIDRFGRPITKIIVDNAGLIYHLH